MLRFIVRLLIAALGVWLAAHFVKGVSVDSLKTLLLAALLLGIVNALVRPVVMVLTLPITIVTLGLFILVVNAAMLGLVAWLLKGFEVHGFVPGLLGALVVSVTSWVGHLVVGSAKR